MSWRDQYERRPCACCKEQTLFHKDSIRTVCVDCNGPWHKIPASHVPEVRTADMLYHGDAPDDV